MKTCLSIAPPETTPPLLNSIRPARRRAPFLAFEPTQRRIKVSLHQLIDDLMASIQPLARKRNNSMHNGVPKGICFIAEENILAYVLWNLLGSIVHARQNESIHVHALVDDDNTTIAFKDGGSRFTRSFAADFPKWQTAAARVGGRINVSNNGAYGNQLAFSISNTRLAV
ncbi:MAG TPA: hypothetical protein VGR89_12955 [Puia sp.]|nr:hypothetical protein [Puia sp.]